MRGSRKFCQRGSEVDNFFLVDEGIEDPNTTINGPSSARQRNAIEMAFRCRWLCSFVIFQGIRTSIAKIHYIFVIFQRGSGPPVPPPLDPPMK